MFIILLLLWLRRSLATKCLSKNRPLCMARSAFIDLNPDERHYYSFTISMDKCNGSCNTVKDIFRSICVCNKIEDMNLKVFNMIKGINES